MTPEITCRYSYVFAHSFEVILAPFLPFIALLLIILAAPKYVRAWAAMGFGPVAAVILMFMIPFFAMGAVLTTKVGRGITLALAAVIFVTVSIGTIPLSAPAAASDACTEKAVMLFQVQWTKGKKVTFEEQVTNTRENGVTRSQALTALDAVQQMVQPRKVRDSQELALAIEAAKRFVRQANGLPEGKSKSFYLKNGNEVTGGTGFRHFYPPFSPLRIRRDASAWFSPR